MKIAICDDEKVMHKELKRCLEMYAEERKLIFMYHDFLSGSELLSSDQEFDIVFMDYQMDGIDGLETARRLRQRNKDVTIIFLTSYEKVVFDSFSVNTFRFLVKPIDMQKLTAAMDAYLSSLDDDNFIVIKSDDDIKRINIDDIMYAEADGKYCIIRTVDGSIKYKKTLSEFEELLPEERFFRTHRSYLVGFRHVLSHTSADISFDNKEKALISKTKLASFKREFMDYIKRYNFGDRS